MNISRGRAGSGIRYRLPLAGSPLVFHSSLLAPASVAALASLTSTQALAENETPVTLAPVTVTASNLYGNVGYTRDTTTAGTHFELSPKEIPQTISIVT